MKDIATISTTSYILEKYRLHTLKKYGQNFLIDSNVIHNIVSVSDIDKRTCVIEIGPGIGALTQVLSRYAKKVISYEVDTRFKPVYEEFLQSETVEIIFQDFLTVHIKEIIDNLKQNYDKVCVVANLPYYITTQIIEKIIISDCAIDSLVIMVQKEVAKKYTSDYKNPLLLMMQHMGTVSYSFTVSKHVFLPVPHVDSAVLKITKEKAFDEKLYTVLVQAFKQRRKTIYNNLKHAFNNVEQALQKSGIENNKRSEELTLNEFRVLTKNLY